jgi:hypothetical protein
VEFGEGEEGLQMSGVYSHIGYVWRSAFSRQEKRILVACLACGAFLVAPFLTVVGVFLLLALAFGEASVENRDAQFYLKFACVLAAVFLGLVNATKVPESDLGWYLRAFHMAGESDLLNYHVEQAIYGATHESSKEPLYSVFVWVMNRLLGGNEILFKFVVTVINYLLLNFAVYKICKRFKLSAMTVLTGICMMSFLPYIFTMSLHLVRQFLAGSIVMYAMVYHLFEARPKTWVTVLLFACAFLIHSTAALFIPLVWLKAFGRSIKNSWPVWVIASLALFFLQPISQFLYNVFASIAPTLAYLFSRASVVTTQNDGDITPVKILFMLGMIAASLWLGYRSAFHPKKGVRQFAHINIIVALFVLLNLDQPLIALRFLFYLWPLFPFVLVFCLSRLKMNQNACATMFAGLFLFWAAYLQTGTWSYAIPKGLLLTSAWGYLA